MAVAILTLLFAFQNCGSSTEGEAKASPGSNSVLDAKVEELKRLVSSDLRCAVDADCEVIAVGERGCGGPASYEILSALNPASENVRDLAAEIVSVSRQFNLDNNVASTCLYLVPPTPRCQQSICVATPPFN